MRNCFPALVKLGMKRQIIHFQCYKLISSKFTNTSIFISGLRLLLRKYLGKKKVWQHLSFLGSAKYEKCGANAHSVSAKLLSPRHYRLISLIKNILPIPLSMEQTLPGTCPHTCGVSAVTGHACSAPEGQPDTQQCLLAFR